MQSPETLEREAEVYCDMVLTGQKPVALVPTSDMAVIDVAARKGLDTVFVSGDGIYIVPKGQVAFYAAIITLANHEQAPTRHWIRGHLLGYSEKAILEHIERGGP